MRQARKGDQVTISYIGTLENGRIFANTEEEGPLTLTLGAGEVFPALEEQIVGMAAGETRNLTLTAAQGYGPRRPENLLRVGRAMFPADRELRVGQKLEVAFADGRSLTMRVVELDAEQVTLDGNHALAGCELTFALRLDRIAGAD